MHVEESCDLVVVLLGFRGMNVAPILRVRLADRFLVGNSLGVADIAVASMFVNYAHAGVVVSATTHPKTAAWVASPLSRPSFAGRIAAEGKLLAA